MAVQEDARYQLQSFFYTVVLISMCIVVCRCNCIASFTLNVILITFGLTSIGPCIVIYSYNKMWSDALISQTYFWNKNLHVSDRSSVHHQESSTVHTTIGICYTGYADCLLAGSEWNILILLASGQQTCMTYNIVVCTVLDSWWWTEERSETCRILFQK